jgi:hypothetical protein
VEADAQSTATAASDAPWEILWVFGGVLVGLIAIAGLALVTGGPKPGRQRKKLKPGDPLKNLAQTWSFKESWASNTTVGAAVITGFITSATPVKEFMGESAPSSLAVASVGAAIGVGLIGAGAIVVSATKTNVGGYFSVGGFFMAVAVALAGAIGQVVVTTIAIGRFTTGLAEAAVWVAAAATTTLLVVYGYRSSNQIAAKKDEVAPTEAVTVEEVAYRSVLP